MKFLLTAFLTLLTFTFSRGQGTIKQDLFKPFTLIIIKPDTARIPDSLRVYADSIERSHLRMYFKSIRAFDKMRARSDDEGKKEIDEEIQRIKLREKEVMTFKYFHSVASKTLFELHTLFNTNSIETDHTLDNPVLEGALVDFLEVSPFNLRELGKRYNADFIIFFENIHVKRKKEITTLIYTTSLYWTKKSKMILKKKMIEGNAPVSNYKLLSEIFPPGNIHERGVYCANYLECMIKSAVRFSTEELFTAISKRQKK